MKKTLKKNVEPPAAAPSESVPVMIENHVVTQKWTTEKPVLPDEPVPESMPVTDPLQAEIFDESDELGFPLGTFFEPEEDPDTRMHTIVSRMGGEQNWSMTIQRLRNYAANGRTDPRSRSYAGYLSIPEPAYLENGIYLEDIQKQFAIGTDTNHFLVCIRRGNKIIGYLPVVSVEPLPGAAPEVNPHALPISTAPAPAPAPPPLVPDMSSIDQLVKTAAAFQKLGQLFNPNRNDAPAPAATSVSSTEFALLTLLNSDGKVVEDLTSKIRRAISGGPDAPAEVTFMHLALKAIETDLPGKILNGIRDIMLEARGIPPALHSAPAVISSIPAPAPAPAVGSSGPAPAPAPAPAPPAQMPPEMVLPNGVIGAYLQSWPANETADWIDAYVKEHPELVPTLDYILTLEPATIRDSLQSAAPQVDLSGMIPFLEELKKELLEPAPAVESPEVLA